MSVAQMLGVPVWIYLCIISMVYLYFVVALTHVYGARKEMKGINKEMNTMQKDMLDAGKRNDSVKMSQLQARQMELMGEMTKLMFKSFIPMIIILPVAALFFWYVGAEYGYDYFQLPFGVPFIHESSIYSSTAFLIFVLFVMGLVVNTIFYYLVENYNAQEFVAGKVVPLQETMKRRK